MRLQTGTGTFYLLSPPSFYVETSMNAMSPSLEVKDPPLTLPAVWCWPGGRAKDGWCWSGSDCRQVGHQEVLPSQLRKCNIAVIQNIGLVAIVAIQMELQVTFLADIKTRDQSSDGGNKHYPCFQARTFCPTWRSESSWWRRRSASPRWRTGQFAA